MGHHESKCISLSIFFSVEEYRSHFWFLAIMNKAAMNIVEQVSLWDGGASFWVNAKGVV